MTITETVTFGTEKIKRAKRCGVDGTGRVPKLNQNSSRSCDVETESERCKALQTYRVPRSVYEPAPAEFTSAVL